MINIFNSPLAFTVIQYQIWNTFFTVSFKCQLQERKPKEENMTVLRNHTCFE